MVRGGQSPDRVRAVIWPSWPDSAPRSALPHNKPTGTSRARLTNDRSGRRRRTINPARSSPPASVHACAWYGADAIKADPCAPNNRPRWTPCFPVHGAGSSKVASANNAQHDAIPSVWPSTKLPRMGGPIIVTTATEAARVGPTPSASAKRPAPIPESASSSVVSANKAGAKPTIGVNALSTSWFNGSSG